MVRGRQLLAWALAAAALAAVALGVIYRAAPDHHHNPTLAPTLPLPPATTPPPPPPSGHRMHGAGLPGWLIPLVIAVGVLLLAYLVSQIQRRPARARRRRVAGPEPIDYAAVAEELARTALARRQLLAGDDARAGVLQAWLDLQTAAERSGVRRGDAETSTEFTARVLSVWAVDPAALGTLAAAYREAHFSDHPIGEDVRQRVIAALARIETAIADHAPLEVS